MTFKPQNRASEAEKLGARILRYFGFSTAQIGRWFGRSHVTICYWTDDNYNARKKVENLTRYRKDLAKGKKRPSGQYNERAKLRRYAREEARETGEPLALVCERLGCA